MLVNGNDIFEISMAINSVVKHFAMTGACWAIYIFSAALAAFHCFLYSGIVSRQFQFTQFVFTSHEKQSERPFCLQQYDMGQSPDIKFPGPAKHPGQFTSSLTLQYAQLLPQKVSGIFHLI